MIDPNSKILIAGANGMVGSAIRRKLNEKKFYNLFCPNRKDVDFTNQNITNHYINDTKPDYIFICAAKVGGILANNTYRADFIYDNLMISSNIINAANDINLNNLCFLGSSCIYPKLCQQPIKEEYLLSGPLEKTNEPYAIAKIAGIKMCESFNEQFNRNYKCVMPTNLYGPNDSYDPDNSHVLPALIQKIHHAKINNSSAITLWGSGKPLREFLYVDDLAEACIYLMQQKTSETIFNIGFSKDISIRDLADEIMDVLDYKCEILLDESKPDGTMRKILDSSKINNMGWHPKISLQEGIKLTYADFINSI